MLAPTVQADILDALNVLPEEFWTNQDDACNCTYQRIGMWTNPYIAETLEVRMCCIWKQLYELFPEHVRTIPAYKDGNAGEWVTEPRDWDGEAGMPESIWHRQLARREGISVEEARVSHADETPPAGISRPPQPVQLTRTQMLALDHIQGRMAQLQVEMGNVLAEAGLDPALDYQISPEGVVTESEA